MATLHDDIFDREEPPGLAPAGAALPVHQAQETGLSGYADLAGLAVRLGPRDTKRIRELARWSAQELAKSVKADGSSPAYYSWRQGGNLVEGPTIDLMDQLAGQWGRLVQEVVILEQTTTRVRLRARVVDLLSLAAWSRDAEHALSPPPGRFANNPAQVQRWFTAQVNSAASKTIRTIMEHAIPKWLQQEALDAAKAMHVQATLQGQSLDKAKGQVVGALGEHFGLKPGELVAILEKPEESWTHVDVGQLRELGRALKEGTVSVQEVRAELVQSAARSAPPETPVQEIDPLADLGLGTSPDTPVQQETPAEVSDDWDALDDLQLIQAIQERLAAVRKAERKAYAERHPELLAWNERGSPKSQVRLEAEPKRPVLLKLARDLPPAGDA